MAGSELIGPARSALPIPAVWDKRPRGKAIRSVAAVAVLAIIFAGYGAPLLWSRDPIGILFSAVAIFLGYVVGRRVRGPSIRRRRRARASLVADSETGGKAIRFTYSAWTYCWLVAVVVMAELFLVALTVLWILVGELLALTAAMVSGGMALYIGWFLVTMLRLAPGGVTLSSGGVLHRGLTSIYFVPWDAVVSVTARWLGTTVLTVEAYPSEDTGVRRYMGRLGTDELRYFPIMVIRAVWLPDPVLVYHALSFYHAHPELRPELSTPDSVDRINSGRAVREEPDDAASPVQPG